ncbi:acyl-ACP thioesterase domain-containing protein [uncultured Croceitalea sp.]|uniref:acyl-CoA thioesterase n=1 Tax=uncultured Croceitalea sp. TaxID=1798908 RepID=UPI00330595CD
MNAYSILKTVTKENLDDLNHVNNVVYVQWIQEISKKHWQAVSKSLTEDYIWVVRRHDITYYDAAKLKEEVLITTNIKTTKGPISFRQVEMKNNKTGKILVKSITEWCLLNAETQKPIRVPDTIKNLFLES